MWTVVLLVCSTPADAGRLGHPDFDAREAAHSRLRAAGVLAVPALVAAAGGDDSPEVRSRAGCLLAGWREFAADQRARAVLYSPWPVDAKRFYADRDLRERVRKLAVGAGISGGWVEETPGVWVRPWPADLVPDDVFDPWCWGRTKEETAAEALAECRRALGVKAAGWPLR